MSTAAPERTTAPPARPDTLPPETPLQTELRVVLFVLFVLGSVNLALSMLEERLSKDVQHLKQFSTIAEELHAADDNDPTTVLLLGNSLTRRGVDVDVLHDTLADSDNDSSLVIDRVVPDNTRVADWYFAFRNFFVKTQRTPDVLLVGFEGGHLIDMPTRHLDRLARYYCTPGDIPELLEQDISGVDAASEFVLSHEFAAFALRKRIKPFVFDRVIPHYQTSAQLLNQGSLVPVASAAVETKPTYERLRKLIDLAHESNTRLVVFTIPVPEEYTLDPDLRALLELREVPLVDTCDIEGLSDDMFPDGLHMNEEAAKLFAAHLGQKLRERNLVR